MPPTIPAPIDAYIRAYNAKDVDGMMRCLAEDVRFENHSSGEVTAEADGRAAFEEMARFGAAAFETREQVVTHAITVADTTLAEISYRAVVAEDLPNGWTKGQALAFEGASLFVVREGKIVRLVDQS
ncbi:MAG: nuclear transport factor 2 family protein [Pseudomonadota bacterium]